MGAPLVCRVGYLDGLERSSREAGRPIPPLQLGLQTPHHHGGELFAVGIHSAGEALPVPQL